MEEISELIRVVNTFTKRNLPLVDLKTGPETENKELRLFLGIKNGNFTTDSKASEGIYGTEEVDFKYRMLKSRLNRKLLNHLFFMELDAASDGSKALRQECMDYLHFAKMQIFVGEQAAAQKLLNKVIDLAKEYEFNDLVMTGLKDLRNIYSESYRPKLFVSLKEEISKFENLLAIEEQADKIYFEAKLVLNRSVNNRKKSLEPIEEAIVNLEKMSKEHRSFNIHEKHLKLNVWYNMLCGNFGLVLKLLKNATEEHQAGKTNKYRYDEEFIRLNSVLALLRSRNYGQGFHLAEEYRDSMNNSRKSWFTLMEYYYLLCVRSAEYNRATEAVVDVFGNKAAIFLDENERERWELYKSYLFFVTGNRRLFKRSGFDDFNADTPEFNKEKAGINVASMILQVVSNLDADLIQLHKILNDIDDYIIKHLNNAFSKRTKTFCKLLYKIVVHNRDKETILSKSRYLVEKLHTAELGGDEFVDLEIIPYEELWEICIQRLSMLRYQDI